jgi:hypothetical protein
LAKRHAAKAGYAAYSARAVGNDPCRGAFAAPNWPMDQ